MKKITSRILSLGLLTMLFLSLLAVPAIALAEVPGGGTTIVTLMDGLKNAVWIVFGGVAILAFVWAGILFLLAQGNAEKIEKARLAFVWGIAGVVVGLLAFSIITIIMTATGME